MRFPTLKGGAKLVTLNAHVCPERFVWVGGLGIRIPERKLSLDSWETQRPADTLLIF